MRERRVPVRVAVRLVQVHSRRVLVLVVRVVDMEVIVLQRLVRMRVRVARPDEQDDSQRHGSHGTQLAASQALSEQGHRRERSDEGAVANRAASRAAPSSRSAYTSRRMLRP